MLHISFDLYWYWWYIPVVLLIIGVILSIYANRKSSVDVAILSVIFTIAFLFTIVGHFL